MDEINGFNLNQMRTLFFQVKGWMDNFNSKEVDKAIESAMIDARKVK